MLDYEAEGVSTEGITFADNADILETIGGKSGSIIEAVVAG